MSHVTCHVSGGIYQVSYVRCHLKLPNFVWPPLPFLTYPFKKKMLFPGCLSKCINNLYAIYDKITVNNFYYRLSQTVCVCPRQSVLVPDSLCLSHTDCVCHRLSAYLSLCLFYWANFVDPCPPPFHHPLPTLLIPLQGPPTLSTKKL